MNWNPQSKEMVAQAQSHLSESRWMEVCGQPLHYLKAGSGPPLFLLHGLLGGSFCWRFNLSAFATCRTTYAIDLAGLGLSDAADGADCGMLSQVRLISTFLESNGLTQVDVVASSWGGAIALLLAAVNPGIRRLVLAAPVNPWSEFGRDRIRFCSGWLGSTLVRCLLPLSGRAHDFALKRMYGDVSRIPPGTLEGYSALLRRRGRAASLINILRNWNSDVEALRRAIPTIKAPVLLIWGSRDGAVDPGSAQLLQRNLTRCELAMLPGVGHLPFEESPEVFNRLVLDFVERSL